MRILLALAAVLLFAACGSSDEAVPTDVPTATANPTATDPGGDVVFCAQIGDGSTPTTPTPVPSCQPGADPGADFSSHFVPTISTPPPLPAGTIALSNYLEFTGGLSGGEVISVPFHVGYGSEPPVEMTVPPGATAYWYTFADDRWQRLQEADVRSDGDEPLGEGSFDPVPANLIVLAEP